MIKSLRETTLNTLGLGSVLEIFEKGKLPVSTGELVDQVFGPAPNRGSLVISGANGIVGAGKAMQLGSRLHDYGVPIVALDMAGSPPGLNKKFSGLAKAFGREKANAIMGQIFQLTYDGKTLPARLKDFNPRFLLEAIPEILELKKSHYEVFQKEFPQIEIRSVTSGFPLSQLGVGIAHPAFPHEINKVWEIVEEKPSAITHLLWSLGMMPIPVSDHWSFVLDVLFCGLTMAGTNFHRASNMPYWKIDKFIRKELGPNPFRAHDAIGAKGANFLTWSCLHHLSKEYGPLFSPPPEMEEHKEYGTNWYPQNHLRPLVNWAMDDHLTHLFQQWIFGPLIQMSCLLVAEKRSHLAHINAMGELCAQFTRGVLAWIRHIGKKEALRLVSSYHEVHPQAKESWKPEVLDDLSGPSWQQLYVNGEHNGEVGVITLSRENYNSDVDAELNRTMDWLKAEGIQKIILTSDFHLSTQMVGADTSEFFPALHDREKGYQIAHSWSKTARRLQSDFKTSVGFVAGKRCLGGMLELLTHCHYLVALEDSKLGMPEVTLPVVPGMEGCHWPFRKSPSEHWPKLFKLLLEGRFISASEGVGFLVDYAGPLEDCLKKVWQIVSGGDHGIGLRPLEEGPLQGLPQAVPADINLEDPSKETARKAIFQNIQASCQVSIQEALALQANHSADFMTGHACQKGALGQACKKQMAV